MLMYVDERENKEELTTAVVPVTNGFLLFDYTRANGIISTKFGL